MQEPEKATIAVGDARAHKLLPWTEPAEAPYRRTAVLAVHGMGQQLPHATLADVARQIQARTKGTENPVARSVVFEGTTRLSRVELRSPEGEVHVYEAWWAPLTEGAVTLRNVIAFLLYAGISNMRRSGMIRNVFGERKAFPMTFRGTLLLYVAILTVVSLLVVNTILGTAVLMRMLKIGSWPSKGLLIDLSVAAAVLSIFALGLGVMIRLAAHVRRFSKPRRIGGLLTGLVWAQFGLTLFAVVATASTMVLAASLHRKKQVSYALSALGPVYLDVLADSSWMILVVLIAIVLISRIAKSAAMSGVLLLVAFAVNVIPFGLIYRWNPMGTYDGKQDDWAWAWIWLIFFVVSVLARQFLVQYVGDVAAYVQPHRLDRFHNIREQIKQCVFDTADAVYRASDRGKPFYDRVVIVAHSLGSVAAYDVLNTLLRMDSARGGHIDVAGRTKALITFGSPLDKIAMLFGKQQDAEMDEALAASIQPLIQKRDRPEWINIYSRNDIISGPLNYFGEEKKDDRIDYDATTPLAAHTEYWNNELLWTTLARYV